MPGVYRRRFANGQVLVNPDSARELRVELAVEHYDVQAERWVGEVTLGPLRAALLVRA